jgi:uncharacterized protein YecE (DUF72 family)
VDIYVGTSGWYYSWNKGRSLDWYVRNTPFRAVELNSSFYRYPKREQVEAWKKYDLKWAIKVNRRITHVSRLSSVDAWEEFKKTVETLNPAFYLFQLPPSFKRTSENLRRVEEFSQLLGERAVFEFRDREWYKEPPKLNSIISSVDSPLGTFIVPGEVIYLRMHGRKRWYFYQYSREELTEIAESVMRSRPNSVFVFFNNDLWMLENGITMLELLKRTSQENLS